MTHLSDEDLVLRFQNGETDLFEILFRRYYEKVLRLIYKFRLFDESRAEDLAQEILLSVYRGLPRFRQKSKLSTYIYAIAYNQIKRYSQRELKKENLLFSLDGSGSYGDDDDRGSLLGTISSKGDDPHEQLQSKQIAQCFNNALKLLPDKLKDVYVLKEIEGLTFREVAEITGNSLRYVQIMKEKADLAMKDSFKILLEGGDKNEKLQRTF